MTTKLNNTTVDERLSAENRPITRLGEYSNAATKIQWECKVCTHRWNATPNSVLNLKSGCPSCYGNVKYTNSDIDTKLNNRSICRIGDYQGFDVPLMWGCKVCNHEWSSSPNGVLTKQSGCPVCSFEQAGANKSAIQHNRVVEVLYTKKITMHQPYTRVVDVYDFSCQVCEYAWTTVLNNIINSNTGCPRCSKVAPHTNESIDIHLAQNDRPLSRVGEYVNATTKIQWLCHKCNNRWEAVPDSVLNANTGCNVCSKLGAATHQYFKRNPYKKTVPGYLYFVEGEYNGVKFLKIGITEHSVEHRFKHDKKKYKIQLVYAKQMPFYEAYQVEQRILQENLTSLYKPDNKFGGRTECFRYSEELKQRILSTI